MADACPSAQATTEPDKLQPDGRGNESPFELIHAELCMYCQALVFNEQEHCDNTWNDEGYRLVWDHDGHLKFELDKSRSCGHPIAYKYTKYGLSGQELPLRTQLIRKDVIPSLPFITATAEAGCHFCRCLLSSGLKDRCTREIQMELCDTKSRGFNVTIEFFYTWAPPKFSIRHLVAGAVIDTERGHCVAEYFLVEAHPDRPCAEMLGIRTKTFLPNWNLDEKVAVMRDWIGHCEKSCHREKPGRTLPSRLLDLGSSRCPNQNIRLIYSKDIPQPIGCKYAALSHCWGSPHRPPLKTETGSLNKMLCDIPFELLPANYQDAVRVARGLGIDYLWIDSLCIVQDSAEDWETESLRMIDVYQQAHVTLVVATGDCCHNGFLNPKIDQWVSMPYFSSLDGSPIIDTYYLRPDCDASEEISCSPWNLRGWTLQENAFSTRRLYFTQSQICFSCNSELHLLSGERISATSYQNAEGSLTRVKEQGKYQCVWLSLTEQYSQRHLTCHKDRLPAISAWAQLLSQQMNDRYLAGLWEKDFLRGLLWSCEAFLSNQTLAERVKFTLKENFIAPSWSWASQTRRIWYRWWPANQIQHCQILEIEVSPIGSNSNPFGRLKSGHTVIHGAVRPLPTAPIVKAKNCFRSIMDSGYPVNYCMDWWDERMDVRSGQEIDRGIVQGVKMLFITSCLGPSLCRARSPCMCGLLLLSTGADEEYWRVGTFLIEDGFLPRMVRRSDFDCGWSTIRIV